MPEGRILLTGDWFRAHPSFGAGAGTVRGNVRWLAGLLSAGTGVPVQRQAVVLPAVTPEAFRADLDHQALAARYDGDPLAAWLVSYDGVAATAAFPLLFDRLAAADLVVGFELPPVMKRVLAARGCRYISIHIHPLRFLPDLVLGLHTNCPGIQRALASIGIPESYVVPRVMRLSARLSRLDPCQARLPEFCPVLFGQTVADASLIDAGRISTWPDHREQLAQLLGAHDHVAFVRHPHAEWPVKTLEWLREDLGKTVIAMAGNAYPVIMSGHMLGPVISMSSSIGVEAAAFGHDSHFLLADPRRAFGVAGFDNDQQFMVGHRFLTSEFWRAMLDGDTSSVTAQADPFLLGENFVRGTLEAWSYSGIAGTSAIPACTKIVMPSRQCGVEECDRLVASLAGLPTGATSQRSAMVTDAALLGVELRCLPAALASGMSWHWDRVTELLSMPGADDLGPTEADGAWLQGTSCTLRLPLGSGAAPGQMLSGEVRFSFFRGIIDRHPALLLRVNGCPVAGWVHRGSEDPYHELSFAIPVPTGGWCTLSLEVSHADSPAGLGLGEDPRQLGIILHRISIAVVDTESADEVDTLPLWGFGNTSLQIPLQ